MVFSRAKNVQLFFFALPAVLHRRPAAALPEHPGEIGRVPKAHLLGDFRHGQARGGQKHRRLADAQLMDVVHRARTRDLLEQMGKPGGTEYLILIH